MHLKPGSLLHGGSYRIEKFLGQGGFGITYMATQLSLNRKVAIKEFFMKEHCNRDASTSQVSIGSEGSKELVKRFRMKFIKEAQTIAELDNHHIIKIFDVFEENGTAYYVMEYLQEGDLKGRVANGVIPASVAENYTRQLCDALSYIHSKNILHLDIKPANVLFRKSDELVLIDFGISKHYDEDGGGQTSSTPVGISHGYAPLEQYKRGGVAQFTPCTDIYSLGATLFKMITGETPPDADEINENGVPVECFPEDTPQNLRNAIVAAMMSKRKYRPESVEKFLEILDVNSNGNGETAGGKGKRKEHFADIDDETHFEDNEGKNDKGYRGNGGSAGNNGGNSNGGNGNGGNKNGGSGNGGRTGGGNGQKSPATPEKRSSKRYLVWGVISLLAIGLIYLCIGGGADSSSANRTVSKSSADSQVEKQVEKKASRPQQRISSDSTGQIRSVSPNRSNNSASANNRTATNSQSKADASNRISALDQNKRSDNQSKSEAISHSNTLAGREYVDLGLSVKWATCNIGASTPYESGNYYAWGETSVKSEYSYENSRTVGKTVTSLPADSSNDVARASWGGKWRMPTYAEAKELVEKCTWKWTTVNGKNGYRVTGPNGKSIFLPTTGWISDGSVSNQNADGYYWMSTSTDESNTQSDIIYFCSDRYNMNFGYRKNGRGVRAVFK